MSYSYMRAVKFSCDMFFQQVIMSAGWAEFCHTSAVKTFSTAICHYAEVQYEQNGGRVGERHDVLGKVACILSRPSQTQTFHKYSNKINMQSQCSSVHLRSSIVITILGKLSLAIYKSSHHKKLQNNCKLLLYFIDKSCTQAVKWLYRINL